MPSGYTAKIKDGISFKEFVMDCARAINVCVMLRDDPKEPIPDKFIPSKYNLDQLNKAKQKLIDLKKMSLEDLRLKAKEEYERRFSEHQERLVEQAKLEVQYRAMLEAVQAWKPPSTDHFELKNFMEQQILDSLKYDCYKSTEPLLISVSDWLKNKTEEACRDIEYYTKENAEEIEITEQRNKWLKLLRESL